MMNPGQLAGFFALSLKSSQILPLQPNHIGCSGSASRLPVVIK
ncbi:hypothetical protein BZ17_3152 [Yersinia pseudotuberculosis IP 32953]|uniref:Uncharacterized protein n=1 Tax=Yersinia pseudotuberculosis serotype O:1b (strain IP 31758) TaxID=349747 RepID=A0A0U1QTU8_YERP3|nr:hypothetical protein YpsIP31758_0511 [Yersinia pseudotuberculosis IP 31758]AJJ01645.1 hypothetical protein BZ21_2773 [Yersinia pseudotuberculosis]AJJ54061.1 hypothetical protein BZ17_3152 [Yersinia pseudotuberculosis IP 32953]AJJ65609.1 hypothetical protein BZ16_2890 [Yersinia pseudotuberculosis PB1/+]AJK16314.1 hypothetical protein BZ19_2917 [Yersinia pseudotuberculosis str. PA3606]